MRTFALALEPTSEAGLAAARETLGGLVRVDVGDGELTLPVPSLGIHQALAVRLFAVQSPAA